MVNVHFETDKKTITVDCRDLFPPEPMEKILGSLMSLQDNQAILMVHHKVPHPLYKKLEERHCNYETKVENDGTVHVLIWKKDNENR